MTEEQELIQSLQAKVSQLTLQVDLLEERVSIMGADLPEGINRRIDDVIAERDSIKMSLYHCQQKRVEDAKTMYGLRKTLKELKGK